MTAADLLRQEAAMLDVDVAGARAQLERPGTPERTQRITASLNEYEGLAAALREGVAALAERDALKARAERLEQALRALVDCIRVEVEAKGGTKRQALAMIEFEEMRARAALGEVKP